MLHSRLKSRSASSTPSASCSHGIDALYQISAPHYIAGIVVRRGYVSKAAPIVGWMRGRYIGEIRDYCEKAGYKLRRIL